MLASIQLPRSNSGSPRSERKSGGSSPVPSGLKINHVIHKSKFTVYEALAKESNSKYAVKIFPLKNGRSHKCFVNEIRFNWRNHENVISIYESEQKIDAVENDSIVNYSAIVMELAPHGSFSKLFSQKKWPLNFNKLARTYFRQFIDGLEYLHENGAAHMDLKLENLLIGNEFKLKITDFDSAATVYDRISELRGTKNYVAPEVTEKKCVDPFAADIYSAAIILFVWKAGGVPFIEEEKVEGMTLYELLQNERETYWEGMSRVMKVEFEEDFKSLFEKMVHPDPKQRATIKQIKRSSWYRKPVLTNEQLKSVMDEVISL